MLVVVDKSDGPRHEMSRRRWQSDWTGTILSWTVIDHFVINFPTQQKRSTTIVTNSKSQKYCPNIDPFSSLPFNQFVISRCLKEFSFISRPWSNHTRHSCSCWLEIFINSFVYRLVFRLCQLWQTVKLINLTVFINNVGLLLKLSNS